MDLENLGTLFQRHRDSGLIAIVDLDRRREIRFDELDDRCNAVARGLLDRGLKPGDHIGILATTRVEYVETLFGAMRAGCIPVPLHSKLTAKAIADIAKDADLRLVFTDEEYRTSAPGTVVAIDFDTPEYDAFFRPGPFTCHVPAPTDPAMLLYTSGSSGPPKGVLLSHFNLATHKPRYQRRPDEPQDRTILHSPLYHKFGLRLLKHSLTFGDLCLIMHRFDARAVIQAIGKYEVTSLLGTPTTLGLMLRHTDLLRSTDLSSVKVVVAGGEPVPPTVLADLQRYFPIAVPKQGYGTTESGAPFFAPPGTPSDSVGVPMPGAQVRLEDGPRPDEGILWVKSRQVMIGYHNRPDENARRLKGGWYNTGDLFRRDAEGYYYFIRRVDDVFKVGGEAVSPVEIERILAAHPAVLQVAVISVESELETLVPVAFVICRPGSTATEAALKEFALGNGPKFMHPRRIIMVTSMPVTATGKVDKRALAKRFAQLTK